MTDHPEWLTVSQDEILEVYVAAGETQLKITMNRADTRRGRDHVTVTVHPLQGSVSTFQREVADG